MKRRRFLRGFGSVGVGSLIAGCNALTNPGTLSVRVRAISESTDEFEKLLIEITGARVKPRENGSREIELKEPVELDLVQVSDGASEPVLESELKPGVYDSLHLEAETIEATLKGGDTAQFGIPGDSDRLTIEKPFDIEPARLTTYVVAIEAIHPGTTETFVLEASAANAEVTY